MHDCIIGAASNYSWKDLKNWVTSIKRTGFSGDIVVVGTNLKKDLIDKLNAEGVILKLYGSVNAAGDVEAPSSGIAPHVERFFYIWNYLHESKEDYRFVITTDTRDVVFQKNPSDWLENRHGLFALYAASEGLAYKDEPWGATNFHQTFGPYFFNLYGERMMYNVGVIAGDADTVQGLMMMIFQMSINRPQSICDQASYNFILNQQPYTSETMFCDHADGFAVNLGTTIEAVKAGIGELGVQCKEEPKLFDYYQEHYQDEQPSFTDEGVVFNQKGDEFVIVHQYDRLPFLKDRIEKMYEDA